LALGLGLTKDFQSNMALARAHPIVYTRIAQKPVWFGILMALPAFSYSGEDVFIPLIQLMISAVFGLIIFSGFVRMYKAKGYQWALLLLLPLAASFIVKSFIFTGNPPSRISKKSSTTYKRDAWSNLE
jgi:hypothetical protein